MCYSRSTKKEIAQARITTGVAVHKLNIYADPGNDIVKSKCQKEVSMVNHVALSLPSARFTDLAKAFGCQKFFIPSPLITMTELRKFMPTTSNDNASVASSSTSIDSEDKLRSLLSILKYIMNTIVKVLAGGEDEAKELKSIYISEKIKGWKHSTLLENIRKIIMNTPAPHDTYRVLWAVFTESMGENAASKYHLGSRRSITRAKQDFKKMISDGFLVSPKKLPRGKSQIDNILISNAIDAIASFYSTAAWSIRCFDI